MDQTGVSDSEPRSRVGVFLTNEHHTSTGLIEGMEAQWRLAEAAVSGGFESIFTGQHFVSTDSQRLQPVPFLARLSGLAPGVTLGTGVHLWSLGNPVAMAEDFASLDVLTGGRFVAGLGLGYRDEEFAAFGIDRSQRVARFERNLEIARALWSGEPVTVDEPWCRLDGATIGTPAVRGSIPVWLGGTSTAAVRRAGRIGDGWMINPAARSDVVVEQAATYRATAAKEGRPARIAAFREVYVAETSSRAEARAMPHLARKYRSYSSWGQERGHEVAQRLDGPADEVGLGRFTVGDPEQVTRRLLRFRDDVGVDDFILRTDWPGMPPADALSSLALLAREVLPALRAA